MKHTLTAMLLACSIGAVATEVKLEIYPGKYATFDLPDGAALQGYNNNCGPYPTPVLTGICVVATFQFQPVVPGVENDFKISADLPFTGFYADTIISDGNDPSGPAATAKLTYSLTNDATFQTYTSFKLQPGSETNASESYWSITTTDMPDVTDTLDSSFTYYIGNDRNHPPWVTGYLVLAMVPEPSTLALSSLGLLAICGLATFSRRYSRRKLTNLS